MNKKLLKVFILTVTAMVLVSVVVVLLRDKQTLSISDTSLPDLNNTGQVYVPDSDTEVADQVFALTGLEAGEDDYFSVVYYEFDHSYAAALLKEPLSEARNRLEAYLELELNLDKEELCMQNISVSVTEDVSSYLFGQNLGLSFCTGSVVLE
ncbi:hypothetical protein CL653_00095 [bacterium]|nr:hypothetical protein [bacterium]